VLQAVTAVTIASVKTSERTASSSR
jgi:hypothetical protein